MSSFMYTRASKTNKQMNAIVDNVVVNASRLKTERV